MLTQENGDQGPLMDIMQKGKEEDDGPYYERWQYVENSFDRLREKESNDDPDLPGTAIFGLTCIIFFLMVSIYLLYKACSYEC